MIVFGALANPLRVVKAFQDHKIRFSFNRPRLFVRNVLFSSVFQLTTKAASLGNRCVVVFDARERLESLENIKIIERDNLDYLLNFFLSGQKVESSGPLKIKPVNYIHQAIELNKSFGLMHRYQTNLYDLKAKDLRDQVKDLILNYVSGTTSREFIVKVLQELYEARRNGGTRDAVKNILSLMEDPVFTQTRECLIKILKVKGPVDNDYLESVCLTHNVEAYDVRYFFAVLTRGKT